MSETNGNVDSFDFSDISLKEIPVKGPDGRNYVLREANGEAAKKFNNAKLRNAVLHDGQVQSVGDLGDLEPLLVSLCLFGEENRPIQQVTIEKWPNRVVTKLYNKALEISDLAEGESPILSSLVTLLSRPHSPVTYQVFKEYVNSQDDEKADPLKDLIRRDEETIKNLRETTMIGSE